MTQNHQIEGDDQDKLIHAALSLYIEKTKKEAAADKKWIEQPNNLISVVAIVISLLTLAYGLVKDHYDGIDKDLQSLSSVVADLAKVDTDATSAIADNAQPGQSGPSANSDRQTVLNNRRLALLAESERLVGNLGSRAPRPQLAVLAAGYMQISNYDKAARYFDLIAKSTTSKALQLSAWRWLAVTRAIQASGAANKERQAFNDEARQDFKKAIQAFPNPPDIGTRTDVILAYEEWATLESDASNFKQASENLLAALELTTGLPCPKFRPIAVANIRGEMQKLLDKFHPDAVGSAKLTAAMGSTGSACPG